MRHNLLPDLYLYSGDFHLQAEDRKDSDDEKSDRNRPWWKKRFVSAIPKGEDSWTLGHFKHALFSEVKKKNPTFRRFKSHLFDCCTPLFVVAREKYKVLFMASDRKSHTLKSRVKSNL